MFSDLPVCHSAHGVRVVPVQGLTPTPPLNTFKLVHYEAQTVRKRAVDIGLKCLLAKDIYLSHH